MWMLQNVTEVLRMRDEIIWMLVYSALGVAVIFFALRVRRLREELRELNESREAPQKPEETEGGSGDGPESE